MCVEQHKRPSKTMYERLKEVRRERHEQQIKKFQRMEELEKAKLEYEKIKAESAEVQAKTASHKIKAGGGGFFDTGSLKDFFGNASESIAAYDPITGEMRKKGGGKSG